MKNGPLLFRETQFFHLGYAKFALAMPPAILAGVTCRQIIWHQPWGSPPVSNGGLVFLTILTLLVYIRLMTVRLVTELSPERLSVAMKGLFRRVRVPVAEIRTALEVEFDPAREYGGYGVRSGPRGEAYIASGNQAVQLELRDGRKLLIGSQQPKELARRITDSAAGGLAPPEQSRLCRKSRKELFRSRPRHGQQPTHYCLTP